MPIKVYVGNLPDNCQKETLRDLFTGYGVITSLDIIKNFAFVHFEKESDANQAVKDLDNTKLLGQVITVQVSRHQKPSNYRDRDDRRRGDKRPKRLNNSNGLSVPAPLSGLGALGGILGAAPGALGAHPLGATSLGGLGILSAVNTLAAAAEQQQRANESLQNERLQEEREKKERERERDIKPDPDVRVRREVVHTRDVPNASRLGLTNGYVIYERYYVDPSHPLLKGLPLPDLPRMTDTYASRDDYCETRRTYDEYRERSPLQDMPPNFGRDPDNRWRDSRDREYTRNNYFDRD